MDHRYADVDAVRLHYTVTGEGEPVLLVHGFPQTGYQWRHIMAAMADRYRLVAPDYRGAGASTRPVDGYDKVTMASDLHALMRAEVGDRPYTVVGHDLGAMVAFAAAATFPDSVSRLVLLDAPVPGTVAWDRLLGNPRVWHVAFHGARDVAEALVRGRERLYLEQFFDARCHDRDAITPEDFEVYLRAYRAPGAMRAAFEAYRALPEDAEVNRRFLAGSRLAQPTLIIAGSHSNSGPLLAEMADEIATDTQFVQLDRCGHWVAEEHPIRLVDELHRFIQGG
jgi:pimeloyl-ACP methyl ester carboxylesterase